MVFFYLINLLLVMINLHLSPLLVSCSFISSSSYNNTNSFISSILCHPNESSALLDFRNSMTMINHYNPYIKTRSWKNGSDCCEWEGVTCHATSHHVVELNLGQSALFGTLNSNSSLFHLRHLRSLSLSGNDFNQSPISPMFGTSFPYLEVLDLGDSNFSGEVPFEISQLSKLQSLILSYDGELYFGMDGSIQTYRNILEMKMSTFYNIISNMTHLTDLAFNLVNINSTIPPSLTNLSSLVILELRGCNLRGELPANVLNLPQLMNIDLGGNHDLHANFALSNWSSSLKTIDLSYVNFSSILPSSYIQSQYNQLGALYLRGCSFHGQIPNWVWDIFFATNTSLTELDLSDNKFNGTINLNDIHPQLIYNVIMPIYGYLNISHNYLTGSLRSLPWNYSGPLDLSYNMFEGPLTIPSINIMWFSASNNNFTGSVPSSLCNLTSLEVLDLSNNSFRDELPHCLVNLSTIHIVLNLGSNFISGSLPNFAFSNCDSLEYLDLGFNMLEGLLPRSLARCTSLKVLNLRNNKFRDEFPHWLGDLSHILVLDLSRNCFFGSLALSKSSSPFRWLQVLDLSNNNFNGKILEGYVESFKAMMNNTHSVGRPIYLASPDIVYEISYFYSTTLTFKGVTLKYDKIITTLATFDLSKNKFEGRIPDSIGKLVSIHGLNLSHNQFTGPIPQSLSNLALLDFLDLSSNKLTGKIPQELTSLTFLEIFNVSENRLVGPIPSGNNFNTYPVNSYNGNLGLCGFPLLDCGEPDEPRSQPSKNDNEDEDVAMMSQWKVAMMGFGFGTFVSFVWGCYMLSIGRPLCLLKLVLILVDEIEKIFGRRKRRPKRGRN